MAKRTYRPISEAPRDGTPIVGVCGGVEACVCWSEPYPDLPHLTGWWHWDDDDMAPAERCREQPTEWRKLW